MAVNYSDDRLVAVEREENKATTEINKTYNDMIEQSQDYYKAQIDASKQWADKQTALQQEKTDFAIEQIEQQKDKAEKDYTKEQSGAYVDWKKQSNRYGANAEAMASQGLANTGYSESSQVSMYNTYQNRVATAREVFNQAMLNYNNMIKDAQLQNNSVLAEIAINSLKEQLELGLQGMMYENQLITEKLNAKRETQQIYHNQYQDVLAQINQEKALAEQIRQYNESLAEEKRQYDSSIALQREQFEWTKAQASKSSSSSSSSSGGGSSSSSKSSSSGGSASINKTSSSSSKSGSSSSKSSSTTKETQTQKDAKTYGTFSNGYQPKGINGYGKVSKTGDKVVVSGKTQNLWKTSDGSLWYWDGSVREYKKTTKLSAKASTTTGGVAGGILSKYINK